MPGTVVVEVSNEISTPLAVNGKSDDENGLIREKADEEPLQTHGELASLLSKSPDDIEQIINREFVKPSMLESDIDYPNWDLSKGIEDENWQGILLYLEERYGLLKTKSIKVEVYPEDIQNLRLLLSLFPSRLSAKLWLDKLTTQKIVKARAKTIESSSSTNTAQIDPQQDASFAAENILMGTKPTPVSSTSESDFVLCNRTINLGSASQVFIFFRDRKHSELHEESLTLLMERLKTETDPDDANILIKTILIFGVKKFLYINKYFIYFLLSTTSFINMHSCIFRYICFYIC